MIPSSSSPRTLPSLRISWPLDVLTLTLHALTLRRRKGWRLSPLESVLTHESLAKPFRIRSYEKPMGVGPFFERSSGVLAVRDLDVCHTSSAFSVSCRLFGRPQKVNSIQAGFVFLLPIP